MKIRFDKLELDFSKKEAPKEETFAERSRREHREFQEDFDRRSETFHRNMRSNW